MKSPFLRAAGILSLLAVSGYVAFSALPLFLGQPETALLYTRTVEQSLPVYGVFLRSETVLPASPELLCFAEGERLSASALGGSGVFTRHVDGYEHLSGPALTPEGIKTLCTDRRMAMSSPGKIITSNEFEFYALTDSAQSLSPGQIVQLETDFFGGIELTLAEKGQPEGEFTALRFYGSGNMDTVMYLRQVSGKLYLGSYTGLCAPERALRREKEQYFVTALTLGRQEEIPVSVLYDGEGFKLISSPLLHAGSEVIINSGGNLP